MNDLAARLTDCFASVFPNTASDKLRCATPYTIEGWNSLASIRLVMAIEEEFEITIKLADGPNLTSFSDILRYLQQEVGESTS